MNYNTFINISISEDNRNVFGTCVQVSNVPRTMVMFYEQSNPMDVEIDYPSLGAVRFCSYDELDELQNEYHLPDGSFVFATCNGDPIFLKEDKVYMTLHGVYRPELLAESFDSFINKFISYKTNC